MLITMDDELCMNSYVKGAMEAFQRAREKVLPKEELTNTKQDKNSVPPRFLALGKDLERIVNDIHTRHGIPNVSFGVLPTTNKPDGVFSPKLWSIAINYKNIFGRKKGETAYRNLKYDKVSPEIKFLLLASTIYHESRHAEQNWLICCWAWLNYVDPFTAHNREHLTSILSVYPDHISEKAYHDVIKQPNFNLQNPLDWKNNISDKWRNLPSKLLDKIVIWYYQMLMLAMDKSRNPNIDDSCVALNDMADEEEAKAIAKYIAYTDNALEMDAFDLEYRINKCLRMEFTRIGVELPSPTLKIPLRVQPKPRNIPPPTPPKPRNIPPPILPKPRNIPPPIPPRPGSVPANKNIFSRLRNKLGFGKK